MKASKYNFFCTSKDEIVAYNSFTGAMALMTPEEYEIFKSFEDGGALENGFCEELIRGGFIVSDECDELGLVKDAYKKVSARTDSIGLTIAPTLNCNFRCVYCYEKSNLDSNVMTTDIQDSLVDYVKRRAAESKVMNITWYGGEPLLALPVIKSLSQRFLEIAQEYQIEYRAAIITNGYLLTPSVAKVLKSCKISHCQITIDGSEKTHNSRRFLKDGSPTFSTIFQNLKAVASILPGIVLRVNVDNKNLDALSAVRSILDKQGLSSIKVYPAPVRNTWDCYIQGECMTPLEFYKFLLEHALKENNSDLLIKQLPRGGNHCVANSAMGFVVSADGGIYKCWCDIGIKEYLIGYITDKGFPEVNKANRFTLSDPFNNPSCLECKMLPSCWGGCPYDRIHSGFGSCSPFKWYPEEYIVNTAMVLKEKRGIV